MSMVHYPWNVIQQINDILGTSVKNGDTSNIATSCWVPSVDIHEEKNNYVIKADLPGMNKDNIEVFMENGTLSIRGERKEEYKTEGNNYIRTERVYGNFHRQFTLPDSVDSEGISASFKDGVLTLSIPKKEISKPKRISILGHDENKQLIKADNQK